MEKVRRKAGIFGILLGLTLLICACGKTETVSAPENAEGAQVSEASNTASSEENKETAKGPSPITVYLVGEDTVAVLVRNEHCKELKPSDEYTESEYRMSVRSEDWSLQIGLSSFYANLNIRMGEDDWFNTSCPYETNVAEDNLYFAAFAGEGLCSKVKSEGELVLTGYLSSGDGSEEELERVSASEAIRSVTMEEFAANLGDVYHPEGAKGAWEGTYLTDQYSDISGIMTVKELDNGILYLETAIGDQDMTFLAVEEEMEGSTDEYFYTKAKIINGVDDTKEHYDIQYWRNFYSETDYSEGISLSMDDYQNGNYSHAEFTKFKEWRKAPAEYKDEDTIGKIGTASTGDSQYFKPATDDYIIVSDYIGQWGTDSTPGEHYNLMSFDDRGIMVQQTEKFIFASDAEASAYLGERTKYENDGLSFNAVGNVLYVDYDPVICYLFTSTKSSCLEEGGILSYWYLDCHYVYGWQDENGEYTGQAYFSKPITANEYSMTLEDVLYWQGIKNGDHPCLESKDCTLYTEVDENYLRFSFYGSENEYRPIGNMHFLGRSLTGAYVEKAYDSDTGDYFFQLTVTEMTFGEKNAEITQYSYKLDDPYSDAITLDNYKTKTPDKQVSGSFDLTITSGGY